MYLTKSQTKGYVMVISRKMFFRALLGVLIVMGGFVSSCRPMEEQEPKTAIIAHDVVCTAGSNTERTGALYKFLEENCDAFTPI